MTDLPLARDLSDAEVNALVALEMGWRNGPPHEGSKETRWVSPQGIKDSGAAAVVPLWHKAGGVYSLVQSEVVRNLIWVLPAVRYAREHGYDYRVTGTHS